VDRLEQNLVPVFFVFSNKGSTLSTTTPYAATNPLVTMDSPGDFNPLALAVESDKSTPADVDRPTTESALMMLPLQAYNTDGNSKSIDLKDAPPQKSGDSAHDAMEFSSGNDGDNDDINKEAKDDSGRHQSANNNNVTSSSNMGTNMLDDDVEPIHATTTTTTTTTTMMMIRAAPTTQHQNSAVPANANDGGNFRHNNHGLTDKSMGGGNVGDDPNNANNEKFLLSKVNDQSTVALGKSIPPNYPSLNFGVEDQGSTARATVISTITPPKNLFGTFDKQSNSTMPAGGDEDIVSDKTSNTHDSVTGGSKVHTTNNEKDNISKKVDTNDKDESGTLDKRTFHPENHCWRKKQRTENQSSYDSAITMPKSASDDTPLNEAIECIKTKEVDITVALPNATALQHMSIDCGVGAAASSHVANTDDDSKQSRKVLDEPSNETRNSALIDVKHHTSVLSLQKKQKSNSFGTLMDAEGSILVPNSLGLGTASSSSSSNINSVAREQLNNNNCNKSNNHVVKDWYAMKVEMKCTLPLKGNSGYYWKTLFAIDACPLCQYGIVSSGGLIYPSSF
jgi:hypothetical protein